MCGSFLNVLRTSKTECCYHVYIYICVCVCVSCVYVYVYICVLMSLQIVEISKRFSLCIVMASVKFTLNDRNVWKAWM